VGHVAIGQPELACRRLEEVDALGRKGLAAPAPALSDLVFDIGLAGGGYDRRVYFPAHGLEAGRIDVAEVDGELHLLGISTGQVGKALDPRRRGAALVRRIGKADVIDGGYDVARAD